MSDESFTMHIGPQDTAQVIVSVDQRIYFLGRGDGITPGLDDRDRRLVIAMLETALQEVRP